MANPVPTNVVITYKYAIQMQHLHRTLRSFQQRLINNYLDKLMNGGLLLLVDPIIRYRRRSIFVLPTLDIDVGFMESLNVVKYFLQNERRKRLWFAEYTGKNGFHLYFRYLVLIDNPELFRTPAVLRQTIFKYINRAILANVDTVSSIRDIPILRIGYRPDTGRTAIPVLNLDPSWIRKVSSERGLKGVFETPQDLVKYILNYVVPPKYITLRQYWTLSRI